MTPKHIVVATDLSQHNLSALKVALDYADAMGARVTLVHVLEPAPTPPGLEAFALEGMPLDWMDRVLEARQQAAEKQLNQIAVENRRAPAVIETRLLTGLMPETLTEFLKNAHADLLVVASHGRAGMAHLFLGSIAEKLMRLSPCPVLVVKPQTGAAASV
jgi:nucleotide-binding universal stress UspA family protein